MKNKIILLLALVTLLSCSKKEDEVYLFSYFKGNGVDGLHLAYSTDAYHWKALNGDKSYLKPEVGNNKLMRDPCIIKGVDGKFHMVWTVSWTDRGIGYANSTDLIHWSEQKYIPVMTHEEQAKNCWAPEIFYDQSSKQYMIYWATTILGRFPKTDSSAKHRNNHRIYYTLTKDFETFSETKLLYDQGFNVIDATIQKVGGTYTMFLKNETLRPSVEKNIRIATSKHLCKGYSQASAPITKKWVEGPTTIKTEEGWLLYFDQYNEGKMGAVFSEDMKHWDDVSDSVLFPDGTRHGSVFKVEKRVLDHLLAQDSLLLADQ